MSAFWAIVIVPVFLASVPANFSIIKYLKEKPIGKQTILDIVYKDFFTCNLIAIVVHGICISYVNTGDLSLPLPFGKEYIISHSNCYVQHHLSVKTKVKSSKLQTFVLYSFGMSTSNS